MHADILREDFVQVVLSRMEPPFDVITSNPPYIPLDEYERLPNSVKEWEDQRALLGDPPTDGYGDGSKGRGLMFYYRIAQIVATDGVLASNGVVALEVGHTQAERVREILVETGRCQRRRCGKTRGVFRGLWLGIGSGPGIWNTGPLF
jgi:release factor glutamine methyltransferase